MNSLVLALAVVTLAVSAFNVFSGYQSRQQRAQIQQQAAYIKEGNTYKQVNSQLINALANVAAQTGDESIRAMLSGEGVTFTLNGSTETRTTVAERPKDG